MCCQQQRIILQQEDVVGFFYIGVIEEKKSGFKGKSPFGDDLEQMRSSDFQKLGSPPAFQLLVTWVQKKLL